MIYMMIRIDMIFRAKLTSHLGVEFYDRRSVLYPDLIR